MADRSGKSWSAPAGTIYPKDGHLSKAQGRLVERLGPVKGWSFVADAESYQVLHLRALRMSAANPFTMLMTILLIRLSLNLRCGSYCDGVSATPFLNCTASWQTPYPQQEITWFVMWRLVPCR